jgi:hypothetical protein
VSIDIVLLSAWFILLSKISGQSDIIIETALTSGRQEVVLPLRIDVPDAGKYIDFLPEVSRAVREAFSNRDIPYEQLLSIAATNGNRISDQFFRFNTCQEPAFSLNGSHLKKENYSFQLFITEMKDKLAVELIYYTDLFDSDTVELFLDYYSKIVFLIGENPQTGIVQFEL